jgi:hypothetical protein
MAKQGTPAKMEKLLQEVFSMRPAPKLRKEYIPLFLGDINTGTWFPGWENLESETVKCGHEFCGIRT